jgi:hypothetical protein
MTTSVEQYLQTSCQCILPQAPSISQNFIAVSHMNGNEITAGARPCLFRGITMKQSGFVSQPLGRSIGEISETSMDAALNSRQNAGSLQFSSLKWSPGRVGNVVLDEDDKVLHCCGLSQGRTEIPPLEST